MRRQYDEPGLVGLARRIIPCLDVDRGRVVKGVNFVGIRDAGVDLKKPVVTMCNSGMSSCSLMLAAKKAGSDNASVFHVSSITIIVNYQCHYRIVCILIKTPIWLCSQ